MPFARIVIPIGLVGLGAVAAYLGAIVLLTSLRSGEINYSYGAEARRVSQTIVKATDPSKFWQAVGLMGGLPLILGAAAVWQGRRMMRRGL